MSTSETMIISQWLSYMYCEVFQISPTGRLISTGKYARRGDPLPVGYTSESINDRIFNGNKTVEVQRFQGK